MVTDMIEAAKRCNRALLTAFVILALSNALSNQLDNNNHG